MTNFPRLWEHFKKDPFQFHSLHRPAKLQCTEKAKTGTINVSYTAEQPGSQWPALQRTKATWPLERIQWPTKPPWTLCSFHWVLPHSIHVHGCQPPKFLPAPSHISELGMHTGRQLRTLQPPWQYPHPL